MIQFIVYGSPKGLKRHRDRKPVMRANGTYFTPKYDPSSHDKADFLAQAIAHKPALPLDVPIFLTVQAYFGRPKSHFNKKGLRPDAPIYHTAKPDCDNLLKFVADSLNGIFWKDDCRICQAAVAKYYDQTPRVAVTIELCNDKRGTL